MMKSFQWPMIEGLLALKTLVHVSLMRFTYLFQRKSIEKYQELSEENK